MPSTQKAVATTPQPIQLAQNHKETPENGNPVGKTITRPSRTFCRMSGLYSSTGMFILQQVQDERVKFPSRNESGNRFRMSGFRRRLSSHHP